jgi:hypothetical protein
MIIIVFESLKLNCKPQLYIMTIGDDTYKNKKRLKINLFTPAPRGSKLIFFAPLGVGVNEENQ